MTTPTPRHIPRHTPRHTPRHSPWTLFLAALFTTVLAALVAGGVVAEEREVTIDEKYKVKLAFDGEAEVIEVEDLEVGESRQFFTDSGKEIVVTRTEEGLDLTVDGEPLEIGNHEIVHKEVIVHRVGDGEEGEHKIMAFSSGDASVSRMVVKMLDEGGAYSWSTADGEDVDLEALHDFRVRHTTAAEFLEEKGVLEDLDEDHRRAILGALEEYQAQIAGEKMEIVLMESDEEEEE